MATPNKAVLIIDDKPLRRAAYMRLIEPWAAQQRLGIVPANVFPQELESAETAMIIISSGGRTMAELHLHSQLKMAPDDIPVAVIISDLEDPREVVAALKSGVRAFIPTAMTDEMALNTLTFVLSGGEYFPISALQARRGSRHPHNEKPS